MIALALILATVTGNPPPTSYACNGSTTIFTIPWPYLAASDVVATQTSATGVVTTLTQPAGYSVKPSIAPSAGTATLAVACPSGSTLTLNRNVLLTQPQSFRTDSYHGPVHEQAFDRLEMQIQKGIQQNATANLTSLSLTAPLPMASGGTGVSSLNCGVGVVTGNGTNLSCVTLSGLAPPGTTGVLLQAVTPGSVQTGHINISGTLALNGVNSTTGGRIFAQGSGAGQILYSYPGTLGASASAHQFDAASLAAFQYIANFTASGATIGRIGMGSAANIGRFQLFGTGGAEISSASGGAPLLLQGSGSGAGPNVIIDTQGGAPTGPLLDVRLTGVSKASIAGSGVITSTGLTSSGPVTGTTFTSSGLAAHNGGVTIGTSGTAISGSFRGTTTWNPGTLGACGAGPCATATTTITVTGAATGADCVAGVTSPAPLSGFPVQCIVTATNTCGLMIVNQSNVSQTFGSATFYCRVFNP